MVADQSGDRLLNFKKLGKQRELNAAASFFADGLNRLSSSPWLIS
jgi:hypothetical protein